MSKCDMIWSMEAKVGKCETEIQAKICLGCLMGNDRYFRGDVYFKQRFYYFRLWIGSDILYQYLCVSSFM